ncbi:MAG TPA: zinc ribbon domain-containing protein [Bryobacteraceae bacterium]|nr:zinc ribbon domain-containing protein [Bryobacteraceae bacterium]
MNWRSGFGLIPVPAKIVAGFAFVLFFFGVFRQYRANGLATLIGLVGGILAAAYFLLAGYVYRDAARRSMPPIPWTALTVLVPNCVGFVLYFVLRKPILDPCAGCGSGVAADAAFCPRCGHRKE